MRLKPLSLLIISSLCVFSFNWENNREHLSFGIYSAILNELCKNIDSDNFEIIINDSLYYSPYYDWGIKDSGLDSTVDLIHTSLSKKYKLKKETTYHFVKNNRGRQSFDSIDVFIKNYSDYKKASLIKINGNTEKSLGNFDENMNVKFSAIGYDQEKTEAFIYVKSFFMKKGWRSGGSGCFYYLKKIENEWIIIKKSCDIIFG